MKSMVEYQRDIERENLLARYENMPINPDIVANPPFPDIKINADTWTITNSHVVCLKCRQQIEHGRDYHAAGIFIAQHLIARPECRS